MRFQSRGLIKTTLEWHRRIISMNILVLTWHTHGIRVVLASLNQRFLFFVKQNVGLEANSVKSRAAVDHGQTSLFVFGPRVDRNNLPRRCVLLHLGDLRPSVHLAVPSCHKVCVKPLVAGRCQFMRVASVDGLNFTALRFITCRAVLFFFFFASTFTCEGKRPPHQCLLLIVICVCVQALGGLGLYHSGQHRLSVRAEWSTRYKRWRSS